jgi:hypothetical protein
MYTCSVFSWYPEEHDANVGKVSKNVLLTKRKSIFLVM